MEFRQLGGSGLRVPVLSFGTATFGGGNAFFKAWGSTDVAEARKLIDLCMDHGVNFFDTANSYSRGLSEEILGQAIAERPRDSLLLSTKATFPMGDGPNDFGSSRHYLTRAVEGSLRRLRTDYIDVFYMHGFDATTPIEETLHTLDTLISQGKIRYIGCSNFSGWHLMKSLAVADRHGWSRYVVNQAYYSLAGREFEWELLPLGLDQKVGTSVWSALAGGSLSGKIRRGKPVPEGTRASQMDFVVSSKSEKLYDIVDVLDGVAKDLNRSISQVVLNWTLQRPTVCNIVIGARTAEQLKDNLGAVDFTLSREHMDKLDAVSAVRPVYPYWHQRDFPMLKSVPVR